jgi:hypothetical protein
MAEKTSTSESELFDLKGKTLQMIEDWCSRECQRASEMAFVESRCRAAGRNPNSFASSLL